MSVTPDSVLDAFIRTQNIPTLPFDGQIASTGIEVTLNTIGKSDSAWDSSDVINQEPFDTIEEVCSLFHSTLNSDEYSLPKTVEDYPIEAPIIKEQIEESCFSIPTFRIIYTIIPHSTEYPFQLRSDQIFANLYKVDTSYRFDGTLEKPTEDTMVFNEAENLLDKIQETSRQITLDTNNISNNFDIHELLQEPDKIPGQDVKSDPCKFTVEDNMFQIIVEHDTEYTFEIPLTEFNSLPDWTEERFPTDLDVNSSDIIATTKNVTDSVDNRWVSVNPDKSRVLVEIN